MEPDRRSKLVIEIDVDELAALIAMKLASKMSAVSARRPYHQDEPPPGETRRSYLDKAARRAFPTSKTGRMVLCLAEDWDAYVASRRRTPRPKASAANDTTDVSARELLERAGVRLRRAAGER